MKTGIVMVDLMAALYWFDEALQARFAKSGYPAFNRTQSLLFANISVGEHRAIRIAKNLGISRQAISQILADLEERKIVVVTRDPNDQRARIVNFHPDANELLNFAVDTLREMEVDLADRIGKENVTNMREALTADWGRPPKS